VSQRSNHHERTRGGLPAPQPLGGGFGTIPQSSGRSVDGREEKRNEAKEHLWCSRGQRIGLRSRLLITPSPPSQIFNNYATCLRKCGMLENALEWYYQCLAYSPTDAMTHANIGFTLHLSRRCLHRALLPPPHCPCSGSMKRSSSIIVLSLCNPPWLSVMIC
jgi:hypothetical protein